MTERRFVIKITNIDPQNINNEFLASILNSVLKENSLFGDNQQDLSLGVHGDHHPQALDMIMQAYRKWQPPGTPNND
tara:strand:- start:87 stop:317 length:231 start_codon:yes stop_codon:yes gene_type:complete